ncbi:MAG: Stp1/IreP family PP2C-type Ser/Thr phosphatase [Syntrophomonas sp.]|jgi:protein phosphatase
MKVAAITDIGLRRKRNEDYYCINEELSFFIVCDGMGGHKGGNVASRLAVETMQKYLSFTTFAEIIPSLRNAVQMANEAVYAQGRSDESLFEMGTTLTAAVIENGNMLVAHVGDSSLFHYKKDGRLKKITRDHTLAEQMLTDGLLKNENQQTNVYNHVLTRAVGVESKVEVDIYQEEITVGDWVLICTDGLTDLVSENEIYEHLKSAREPQATAQALLDLAMGKGGYDNITIVLLSV